MNRLRRIRLALLWIVSAYLALKFVRNGVIKFDPDGFWTGPFERWGYPAWLRICVGVIESLGGLAILIPRISAYGSGALMLVMAGAMMTRARDGAWSDVVSNVILFLALAWVGWERLRKSQGGPNSDQAAG